MLNLNFDLWGKSLPQPKPVQSEVYEYYENCVFYKVDKEHSKDITLDHQEKTVIIASKIIVQGKLTIKAKNVVILSTAYLFAKQGVHLTVSKVVIYAGLLEPVIAEKTTKEYHSFTPLRLGGTQNNVEKLKVALEAIFVKDMPDLLKNLQFKDFNAFFEFFSAWGVLVHHEYSHFNTVSRVLENTAKFLVKAPKKESKVP